MVTLIAQTTAALPADQADNSWVSGIALLITALTGAGGCALAWFKHFLPRRQKSKKDASFVTGLQEVGLLYEIMEDMLSIPVDQCIVFAAHNSGGVPRIGSPFYTTAVNYRTKRQSKIPLGDYKEMAVDGVYVNMLVKLRESNEVLFVTSENPNCYLGDIHRNEGISEAVLFYLGVRENKFLYLSVSIYDGKKFTEDHRTMLRIRAALLRTQVSKTIN